MDWTPNRRGLSIRSVCAALAGWAVLATGGSDCSAIFTPVAPATLRVSTSQLRPDRPDPRCQGCYEIPGLALIPAEGVRVSVTEAQGSSSSKASTGPDGSFLIPEKLSGGAYQIVIDGSAQGFSAGRLTFRVEGDRAEQVDCRISRRSPPTCAVTVRPTWGEKNRIFGVIVEPAIGAQIEVADEAGFVVSSATAERDGRFMVRGVKRGPDYVLSAGVPAPVPVLKRTFNLRPQLVNLYASFGSDSPSGLEGWLPYLRHTQQLADRNGQGLRGSVWGPLGGVEVGLRVWTGGRIGAPIPALSTTTRPNGEFTITKDLDGKSYVLDFGPPSLPMPPVPAAVGNPLVGDRVGIGCTILPTDPPWCAQFGYPSRLGPPPHGVRGEVRGPLKSVRIEVADSAGNVVGRAVTDVDGIYKIPALGPGAYCLKATPGRELNINPVEVTVAPYEFNFVIRRNLWQSLGDELSDANLLIPTVGDVCHRTPVDEAFVPIF
jgi:hypothetical protein